DVAKRRTTVDNIDSGFFVPPAPVDKGLFSSTGSNVFDIPSSELCTDNVFDSPFRQKTIHKYTK
ncbi:hypothetical protein, partial [Paenibacillus sp. S28]|uniref:hypothetical protein n=1 Tax=Paenibacillus sp. S28 TaxID=2767463 RepID=UPI001F30C1D3